MDPGTMGSRREGKISTFSPMLKERGVRGLVGEGRAEEKGRLTNTWHDQ